MNPVNETLSPDEKGLPRIVRVLSRVRDLVNKLVTYVYIDSGDPVTVEPDAPLGSIYLRTDTGRLYVKQSATSGVWTMK